MHVWVWSRPDIGYAMTRLPQYTHAPNTAAFAGLYRILRYLATHPHRPILYPRRPLTDVHELRFDYDAPNFESITLPNGLLKIVDSDHARDNATRRSCHCVLALLCRCFVLLTVPDLLLKEIYEIPSISLMKKQNVGKLKTIGSPN
eukprot:scaffold23804_cov48-Cyclotella_meneghiniana.AAC.3